MSNLTRTLVRLLLWAIVAALSGSLLYAYHLSNPRIGIPSVNRERFANVAVLLDGTASMSDVNLAFGKRLVTESIIPNEGIGDRLATYSIGPEFSLHNLIAGATYREQPPQLTGDRRADVLEILRQARSTSTPGRVRSRLYRLIDELRPLQAELESTRAAWIAQIEAMKRPTAQGSNLACALDALDSYLQASSDPSEERWLFIVSDLIQDTALRGRCEAARTRPLFAGVRVVLIYPHDSRHDWPAIIDSWRTFLGDRELDVYPFSAALNRPHLLPPNPLAGLHKHVVKGFWRNLLDIGT